MVAYKGFFFTKMGGVRAHLGKIAGLTVATLAFSAVNTAVSGANRAGFEHVLSPINDLGKETFFIGLKVYRSEAFGGHFRKDYSICLTVLNKFLNIRVNISKSVIEEESIGECFRSSQIFNAIPSPNFSALRNSACLSVFRPCWP
jgi:hypothetical protein